MTFLTLAAAKFIQFFFFFLFHVKLQMELTSLLPGEISRPLPKLWWSGFLNRFLFIWLTIHTHVPICTLKRCCKGTFSCPRTHRECFGPGSNCSPPQHIGCKYTTLNVSSNSGYFNLVNMNIIVNLVMNIIVFSVQQWPQKQTLLCV